MLIFLILAKYSNNKDQKLLLQAQFVIIYFYNFNKRCVFYKIYMHQYIFRLVHQANFESTRYI